MQLYCVGKMVAILAAATIGLAVADLVLTSQYYCNGQTWSATWCSGTTEPYVWVWVASGIWGSVPVFFTGLYLLTVGGDTGKWNIAWLLILLSAWVFGPATIILTVIELVKGSSSQYTFYTSGGGSLVAGNIHPSGMNPWQAKFALPLTELLLAFLTWLKTFYIFLLAWCCNGPQSAVVVKEPVCNAPVVAPPMPCEAPRPVQLVAQPPCVPCNQSQPYVSVNYSGCGGGYSAGVRVGSNVAVNVGSPAPGTVYHSW